MKTPAALTQLMKGTTTTFILSSLEEGDKHGYAIIQTINSKSRETHGGDSGLNVNESSIYPALRALEAKGLVKSRWEHPDKGMARKVYSLTGAGRDELKKQRQIWRFFADAVDRVVGRKETDQADEVTDGTTA